jgi:hypothetical protein
MAPPGWDQWNGSSCGRRKRSERRSAPFQSRVPPEQLDFQRHRESRKRFSRGRSVVGGRLPGVQNGPGRRSRRGRLWGLRWLLRPDVSLPGAGGPIPAN